jgi:hypothetical protein
MKEYRKSGVPTAALFPIYVFWMVWCVADKQLPTLRITGLPPSSGSDSEGEGVTPQKTRNLPLQLISTVLTRAEQYKPLLHRH